MTNLSLCSGKVSSLREAGRMFNVNHCDVSRLIQYRKEGKQVGHKRKYLTEQEEKHIAERYDF